MPNPIDIKAVAKDKFIVRREDGRFLGDISIAQELGIKKPCQFVFIPMGTISLTEAELTRITRIVRRQNRILSQLNPNNK